MAGSLSHDRKRLLFVGLDGVPFDLCRLMMAEGDLPVLRRLSGSGVFGPLISSIPPHTAPAWTSIFTGVGPGEHGMYQFWDVQDPNYGMPLRSSADLGWKPIWRALAEAGRSVGVCNIPMTHPPETLPGWMLSWPLGPSLGFAEPHDILHDLAKAGFHYHPDITTMWAGSEAFPAEAIAGIGRRCDALLYLIAQRPVDAVFAVFTEFDRISHYHWTAEGPLPIVKDALRCLDEALGRLVDAMGPDTTVVVASDHGFGPCLGNVQINRLLVKTGLLVENDNSVPEIPPHEAALGTSWSRDRVIWEKSRAYMPTPGCYGINLNKAGRQRDGIVQQEDIPLIENDIRIALDSLRGEAGDGPQFKLVRSGEVYHGHRASEAPDYLLLPRDWGWMAHPGLLEREVFASPTQPGVHTPEGMVLISGPEQLDPISLDARVEDVGATLLSLSGLPIPAIATGKPLSGLPYRRAHVQHWRTARDSTHSTAMAALAERQLTNMGYL